MKNRLELSRRPLLVGLATCLLACDDKATDTETGDDDKDRSRKSKRAKPETSATTFRAPKPTPKRTPAWDAHTLGRQYAFACVFAMLDKPSNVSRNMTKATAAAKKLGIAVPKAPTKAAAMESMRDTALSDALAEKHDEKVASAFSLGIVQTDLFFGVSLETKVDRQVAAVRLLAEKAGVPAKVYDAALKKVEAGATSDNVKALNKGIDAHFGYAG